MELTSNENQNETRNKHEKGKHQNEHEFNTSTQKIHVPYLNLIINSQNIQEEIIRNSYYLFQYYSDKLKDLQQTEKIKEESISTFFSFMNGKDIELKKEEFIDLFKLIDIFKVNSLEKILKQFLIDN